MTEARTLNVAVFGAGRIGRIHAANLARQSGVRLKYVIDVNREAAAALAAQHGAQVADVDGAFGDASIDATVICSSTDTHSELILKSAAAGKHIFCEKPVDLAIGRARECAEAVARAGVVAMIGFQRRYDPTFAALKARLDAGEIGTPEMLIVTSRDPGAPPVEYIKHSGGIFKDMLIHDFDIFRWILDDEADTVHATGSCLSDPAIADAGDIDSTAVTIRTKRGRLCQINTARRAAYGYDQRFEILGSDGMLQAGNMKPTEVVAWTKHAVAQDVPEAFFLERYRAAYAREMAHFYEAVTQGTPVRTSVADGLKALELAEAAALSWREGRVVKLGA
ncbi:inositol 2-dehydrogenase [Paraburkholderia silviterrae]|uniref:Inositol 2-dehydrogenase n=1 Tax=Paraburkholderia silviterrae TaxID=2528715 RepID=A0A4R5MAN8_9BURK|nr:inositol 2-dehydrogenase [Paraburkholderia silviterrae]TDG23789.1 inositol 2-dehydrogenase [Paraburkholderia silviterrae]